MLSYREALSPQVASAMAQLINPGRGYIGCAEVIAVLLDAAGARLTELASLPLGARGQKLVALRYFIANGETWLRHFAWERAAARAAPDGEQRLRALRERIRFLRAGEPRDVLRAGEPRDVLRAGEPRDASHIGLSAAQELCERIESEPLTELAASLEHAVDNAQGLGLLLGLDASAEARARLAARLAREAGTLCSSAPQAADLIYLASYELSRLPATTCGGADLAYLIVADKGEMGVRAVREAVALGATPVVLFSQQDDQGALQVRLAQKAGGFGIALEGGFRESYANYAQIARKVQAAYLARFGERAEAELARSALYPGYGPLAENTAAIEHFRKSGIVFVGPMQDVVERAGDKRKFRLLSQSIDPAAVVPGIVIDENEHEAIVTRVREAHARGAFRFPGRLKAANGGGGRGQVVVLEESGVEAAVHKVLGEIAANGWDAGVMFEQNIPETIHLEVQVVRDRFGNTRHFGMRDCSEQRASQKIQEEAPPALLRFYPDLAERICTLAVRIADEVGYVGACTVELMFKDGHFYLLEMNTRIQVEHPVTEAAHRLRTPEGLAPLNLVALQLQIARGQPIQFAQADIVCTHVAREFRINAESWRPDLKDSRDGKPGLFLPNAGAFSVIEVPEAERVREVLENAGVTGITDLTVRFDCGFEPGDKLVNKDPTFGKLIVALTTDAAHEADRFELLRRAAIEVLNRMRIEGRQVLPTGQVIAKSHFATNLLDHVRILQSSCMRQHARERTLARHVNWVVDALRKS
jgi:acetyl/propionyl-CoA carboxylase alpha subunit